MNRIEKDAQDQAAPGPPSRSTSVGLGASKPGWRDQNSPSSASRLPRYRHRPGLRTPPSRPPRSYATRSRQPTSRRNALGWRTRSCNRASSCTSCGPASAVLPEESQAEIAPLMDAYIHMLGPSRLIRGARRRISEMLLSAESAVVDEAEHIARPSWSGRARNPGRRRRAWSAAPRKCGRSPAAWCAI